MRGGAGIYESRDKAAGAGAAGDHTARLMIQGSCLMGSTQ